MIEYYPVWLDKSLPWQDGYFAKREGYVLDCPYDELSQWASSADWHAGYLFAEEEGE